MGEGTHIVHWLSQTILTHALPPLTKLRDRWAEDRGRQWTDKEWQRLLAGATYIPRNSRFKLIQTYIIHRAYLTPNKTHQYFSVAESVCPRCRHLHADLLHMLWSCPELQTYWHTVAETLTRSTGIEVALTWEVCILSLCKRTKTNKTQTRFCDLGLITATRLITKTWTRAEPPQIPHWHKSLDCWARAESVALHREETAGLRTFPIAQTWDNILKKFTQLRGPSNRDELGQNLA